MGDRDVAVPPACRLGRAPAARWGLRLLLLVVAVYVVSTVPGVRAGAGYNRFFDGWLQNGILVAAGCLVYLRCWKVAQDRVAWLLIGTGILLYSFGNIAYFLWVQYLDPLPYPAVSDFLWLAMYPFAYAGLVLLVRTRVRVFHPSMWLDGIVGAFGVSAFASLALPVILRDTGGSLASVVTTMGYPIGDLLLLVLLVGICGLLGWRPDRLWVLLGLGMLLFAAADTIYLLRVATDTYQAGTLLDPMWAVGSLSMALAALRQPNAEAPMRLEGWAVLVIPSLVTVGALGLLVYGSLHSLPLPPVVLATAAVLCGVVRAGLTFREVQALADSRRQARTDELTGLGNRRGFYEKLQARIDAGGSARLALLIVDLDRFKEVNDAFGHTIGDQLLVEVGRRLARHMRHHDVLARLGGDEFAVMLDGTTGAEAAEVAERLRTELQHAFRLDGVLVHVDASIGIAVCPDVATTVTGLLQRADIAMYQAKSERTGCQVYEKADDDDLRERLRTVEELRTALEQGQLVLHYQPKVDLRTGDLVGVEALVRWQHPERGLLYPDAFIAEAERAGLMRRLTVVVLALALDQVQVWRAAGLRISVSVNISASNLLDLELPRQVDDLLSVRGLTPDALVVEITESTLMRDRSRSLAVLDDLRARGVRISIDDYGTGYSSLAYLRDLPVDELKLDRSFVGEMDADPRADAIVESTIRLAHSLGLRLVAEGIETAQTLERLGELGCDLGQGYHLGRPMPAERLAGWLADRRTALPAPRTARDGDDLVATSR